MTEPKTIYRVQFVNQDKLYEVYCSKVYQSDLYGFIELEALIFGERSKLLVDPSEEKLQQEFSGVKRSFVPMQAIVRIDEVDKEGVAKISDSQGTVIHTFPTPLPTK